MHFFFCRLFSEITYAFKPDAIVVQCGADCLTNDPLGGFNLTPLSIANCLKKVVSKSLPTLILGGGGYNKVGISINSANFECFVNCTNFKPLVAKDFSKKFREINFFKITCCNNA